MNKIERLSYLLAEVSEIKEELDATVLDMAMEYVTYDRKKYPRSDYPSDKKHFDDWDFSSDGFVNLNWSEYWAYGGRAEGTISFPIRFLENPSLFEKFKNECIAVESQRNLDEKCKENAKKEAEFERLRKELNKP